MADTPDLVSQEEAERLLKEATPGPWYSVQTQLSSPRFWVVTDIVTWVRRVCCVPEYTDNSGADAALIAAAPSLASTVIALHDVNAGMKEVLSKKRAELTALQEQFDQAQRAINRFEEQLRTVSTAKDATIAELEKALEAVVTVGTRVEVRRVGDMYSSDGWEEFTIISKEAEIASAALSHARGGE